MYNKLFAKILDSSIWLAPDPYRLVWITLLAAMDEDGNAMFACVDNLALRARVPLHEAESAVKAFEAPDHKSGDPDNEGRRIERIPGGWHILNAHKYRAIVTRAVARENTRNRVAAFRARQKGNADVTPANVSVTPSEADTDTYADSDSETPRKARAAEEWNFVGKVPPREKMLPPDLLAITRVFEHWKTVHRHPNAKLDPKRMTLLRQRLAEYSEADLCQSISGYCNSPHHMGQNDKATVYDALELFMRDAAHVDAGLKFYAEPPRTDLSEKTRRIISQTENWMPPEMREKQ